jgi:hypothetical protein
MENTENENVMSVTDAISKEGQAGTENLPNEPAPVEMITLGEELTADDLNRVYARLGRPESPDKYDLSGVVEDTANQSIIDEFKKKAKSKEAAAKDRFWSPLVAKN